MFNHEWAVCSASGDGAGLGQPSPPDASSWLDAGVLLSGLASTCFFVLHFDVNNSVPFGTVWKHLRNLVANLPANMGM